MFKKAFRRKKDFKFNESENVICVVCNHIVEKERVIKLVAHDLEDGQWHFLCGENDHEMKNYKLVTLKHVIEIDESVNDLNELPMGFGASRKSKNEKWIEFKQEEK